MRTKQVLILGLILAIIASFVIVPMLTGGKEDFEETPGAEFTFAENLATNLGNKINVKFEIKSTSVLKTELFIDDSLLQTWKNPSGILSFDLDASYFGLGAKTISLISKMKNGEERNDSRLLRILSDVAPEMQMASSVKVFKHKNSSFTQGLEFSEGILYESTGLNNQSKIAQINLESGEIIKEIGLDGTYFGEGITILNDKIFQITWQNQKCFTYDKKTLQIEKEFSYVGEGWGLCNDGKSIIMSDGTETITFRNPKTFQIEKTIQVYDNVGPRVNLNELEYIDGKIYANIWMLNIILVIDPNTGKVLSEIDCEEIVKIGKGNGEVLNGIAYNPLNKKTYLTGKNWSKLIEVKFQ